MRYSLNTVFGLELPEIQCATHRRCVRPQPPGAPGQSTPAHPLWVGSQRTGAAKNSESDQRKTVAISAAYATQPSDRDAVFCLTDYFRYGPSVPLPYSLRSALLETALLCSNMRT